MNDSDAIIRSLFSYVLNRDARADELAFWSTRCHSLADVPNVIKAFFTCEEYKSVHGSIPGHPPGHFYSPINNPSEIDRSALDIRRRELPSIPGIDLNLERQRALWAVFIESPARIVADQIPERRYFHRNPVYGPGDALVLSKMIEALRPRRIIEIGSGFSSACMLDAREDHALDYDLTFIEPHPNTLFWHLREQDRSLCRVIQLPAQKVDLDIFMDLEEKDILFIDSTHIMKSGSDVNFELFEILPRLKSGVIVHFHDVFWPFEYPADWLIDRRYSWNELYGLRAYLMNNPRFKIIFFNDAFNLMCSDTIASSPELVRDLFTSNPGGGLWLEIQ